LLVAGVVLAAAARRVGAPYPVFLALGGALLAFLPGAPSFSVPPELALALFVAPVLRPLRPPHRILTILEGESLLNDASALLIFRVAVGAVAAKGFSIAAVAPTFLLAVAGSLVVRNRSHACSTCQRDCRQYIRRSFLECLFPGIGRFSGDG
jgi:NhaP-type Na+/H+ or K+/H+ antiporter